MSRFPDLATLLYAACPIRAGLAVVLACAFAASADGVRAKRILSLGTLGGTYSHARGINEAGTVVGEARLADGETHAFYWKPSDRRMVDLGTLGGGESRALDINDRGLAVGTSHASPEDFCGRAVVWNTNWARPPLILPDLIQDDPFSCSYPVGINDAGVVAGNSGRRPVRWIGGRIEPLALPPGLEYCQANSINDRGWILLSCSMSGGARVFLWKGGPVTPLAIRQDGVYPADVNGNGQVVGYGWKAGEPFRAFAWRNGVLTRLAGFGKTAQTMAMAISENGWIAGEALVGGGIHAVAWDPCGRLMDLGTLPGSDYSSATAVNTAGIVAGVSSLDTGDPGTSGYQAVIWR